NDDCRGERPFCELTSQRCVACLSDGDCKEAAPVCDPTRKACFGCTRHADCSGSTPVCDLSSHRCVPCSDDGPPSCLDPTRPVCQKSGPLAGSCTECSAQNASRCSGLRPVCQ